MTLRGRDASRRRALAALCLTEVVSYGVLYYAFPVLAPAITRQTGWSPAAVTVAFSIGNLVGAATGVPVGRWLHRHGPRPVMTAGGVLGTAAVVGVALAPSYGLFVTAWAFAGVAMAGLFYPPAFAALTGWYGPQRVRALTTLTLVAGFASTVFAPLTAALAAQLSWRESYLVLAAVLAIVTIPAHTLALRLPWPTETGGDDPRSRTDRQVITSRPFLLLTAAATLTAFALYAAVVNLVPLLTGRGLSTTLAAWALGLGGVGQVAGRLAYRMLAELSVRGRAVLVIGAAAVLTLAQALVPGPATLLIAVSIAAGSVRGMFTLVEATLVADHWGATRYAALNGVFIAPITAISALAPSIGAAIAGAAGSYPLLFTFLAIIAAIGVALAALVPSPAAAPASTARSARRSLRRLESEFVE